MSRYKDSRELIKGLVKPIRRSLRYSVLKRWAKAYHGSNCVDCGSEDNIEWDHQPPVVPVNQMSWEMTPLEYFRNSFCLTEDGTQVDLERIVPRCRTCHLAITKSQLGERVQSRRTRGIQIKRKKRKAKKRGRK